MNATYEDFQKLEIKIGKVLSAEKVENADKLLKLEVDFGEEKRQIIAGIAEYFEPSEIIGKQFPFIINLEPRKIRGLESNGMILAVDAKEGLALLVPQKEVSLGSKIR